VRTIRWCTHESQMPAGGRGIGGSIEEAGAGICYYFTLYSERVIVSGESSA
jgi:hypothetical protein